MNSSIQVFLNARDRISDNKTFLEIKQHYKFNKKTLHVFVEAENDYEFYRKSIEYIYKEFEVICYPKNGKRFVLSAYDVLNWKVYDKSRILFFADKDYDDLLGYNNKKDRNIFITKFYSIENYLSSRQTFKYILENIFRIKNDSIVESLIARHDKSFEIFEDYLKFLTSIILIYRKASEHMDLSALKMEDFFIFKELEIHKKKYKNPSIFNSFINSPSCLPLEKAKVKPFKTIDSIKKTGAELDKINYKLIRENFTLINKTYDSRYYLRGKFHLWFFLKCITNVHSLSGKINYEIQNLNIGKDETEKKTKMNTSLSITESNIFDILPMKINKHNDVNIFLIQNKQKING